MFNFSKIIRKFNIIEIGPKDNINNDFNLISKESDVKNNYLRFCQPLLICHEITNNCSNYYFTCSKNFNMVEIYHTFIRQYIFVHFFF